MKQILIARESECERLKACMESDQSEFITVCGRRRIGKTYIVDCFFNRTYDFSYVGGHKLTTNVQLRNFAKAIKKHAKLSKAPSFENWFDAFDALEEYLEHVPEREEIQHYLGYTAISSYYWYLWALYQERNGKHLGTRIYTWYKNAKQYAHKTLELFEEGRR